MAFRVIIAGLFPQTPGEGKEHLRVYLCSVCGYEYEEAAGDPRGGIAPGTRWEDVPEDWVCPICGADKSMFTLKGNPAEAKPAPRQEAAPVVAPETEAQAKRLSIMLSNLGRGAEKQYRAPMAEALTKLAGYYEAQSRPLGGLLEVSALLQGDLDTAYPAAFETARAAKDRGALRALTWGEKVSKIQQALISRFQKEGGKALEGGSLFVCEACGFIFYGAEAPDICPVCKVPRFKFTRMEREAS